MDFPSQQELDRQYADFAASLRFGVYHGHLTRNEGERVFRHTDDISMDGLRQIIGFYRRNEAELERIARECAPFLLSREPWKHPGEPFEFVCEFGRRLRKSGLREELASDIGVMTLVAERGISLNDVSRLVAFQTKVYGRFADRWEWWHSPQLYPGPPPGDVDGRE
jgi:hypothetical protein